MQLTKAIVSSRIGVVTRLRPSRRSRVTAKVAHDDHPSAPTARGIPGEAPEAAETSTVEQQPPAGPATPPMPSSFQEMMTFGGSLKEIVNGRLAILGFVAAVAAELCTGDSLLKHWAEHPNGIAAAFLLITAASVVTASLGRTPGAHASPAVQLINSSSALMGFAAMLALEAARGGAMF